MIVDKPLFSPCELEVIGLVAKGLTNKQCAEIRCVAEKTIKWHLTSVFKKLGITKRSYLIVLAFKAPFMFEPGYVLSPIIGEPVVEPHSLIDPI